MIYCPFYSQIKRAIDILGSLIGIILLLPLFLFIILLQFFLIGRPILFAQKRDGFNGVPFILYKFRSMPLNSTNSQSISSWGLFLRSSSLDELPQLFNVLIGDMSFVGPRPLLCDFSAPNSKRLSVRPGITGWAQVNGRNSITHEERLQKDLWYVDNYSFLLDLKILFKTFFVVLKRDGI